MRSDSFKRATTDGHAFMEVKKMRIAAIYMVRYDSQ
jgi:hypothetical protein